MFLWLPHYVVADKGPAPRSSSKHHTPPAERHTTTTHLTVSRLSIKVPTLTSMTMSSMLRHSLHCQITANLVITAFQPPNTLRHNPRCLCTHASAPRYHSTSGLVCQHALGEHLCGDLSSASMHKESSSRGPIEHMLLLTNTAASAKTKFHRNGTKLS